VSSFSPSVSLYNFETSVNKRSICPADHISILHTQMQLDYLTTARNDRDLKSMVNTLPDGLEHTYDSLLTNAATQCPERIGEMKTLLQCLVIATPTLTASNLAEILAMQLGEHTLDFDAVATDPYDALDMLSPFLLLDSERKDHGIVKLSHYSLDEYLLSDQILQSSASSFHLNYKEGHAWMASICLQYLTFDVFHQSRYEVPPSLERYTFTRYAASNWFRHFDEAKDAPGLGRLCEPYFSRLFYDQSSSCFRRWQKVYCQYAPGTEIHRYSPICFAISQGMDEIVGSLLSLLPDIDVSFTGGYTCPTMAAKWNRASSVRKLLDLKADIEKPTVNRCTPLHLAAEFACREAFDILLNARANLHARSSSGTTPFYRACRGGDVHIVKLLKDRGSDINIRTQDSWTPIMEAVENGHEEVVDLLLEWGADLSIKTDQVWTAQLVAEDGFNLAPNRSIIKKLKQAAPDVAHQRYFDLKYGVDYETGLHKESVAHHAKSLDAPEASSRISHARKPSYASSHPPGHTQRTLVHQLEREIPNTHDAVTNFSAVAGSTRRFSRRVPDTSRD
jgi:ankyrin repeat protein